MSVGTPQVLSMNSKRFRLTAPGGERPARGVVLKQLFTSVHALVGRLPP